MNTPTETVITNSHNAIFHTNNAFYNNNINIIDTLPNNDNISSYDSNDEDRVDLTNVKVPVFRFKLSNNVFNTIREFSRIHQHDDRITFKESWETWSDDNKTLIDNETQRLSDIGFGSNMNEKLFRTAKYYFVKKTFNPANNANANATVVDADADLADAVDVVTVVAVDDVADAEAVDDVADTNETINAKKYITISRNFLNCISGQIEQNIGNNSFTPAKGYAHFIEHFNADINHEIALIKEKTPDISNDDCNIKIKKTYKNKFYQYTNKYGIKQT